MLLSFSLIFVLHGLINYEPEPIALGGMIYFFSYPVKKYLESGITSVTPATLYSMVKGLASLSNLIGLISYDDPDLRKLYFKYVAEDQLVFAMVLHYVGSVITIFGFDFALKNPATLPKLSYNLSRSQLSGIFPPLIFMVWFLDINNLIPSLGAISNFLEFIPVAAIFFLARYGAKNNEDKYLRYAFFFLLLSTAQAVLYSYLRANMVLPSIAFIIGMVLGGKSAEVLKRPILYPVYGLMLIFVTYFSFIGNTRTQVGTGFERIEMVQGMKELEEGDDESTFLSRLSNLNQLSQIGRVAEEDGFYNGKTMAYFTYGFIPRFIWPEKPIIQQGAWFAYRIGMGRMLNGRYTNSIDMTPPGELYLNFGWLGVIAGTFLFGCFFGKIWLTTNFWESETNILGSLFGFYLLFLGLFSLGADMQVIITVIAMYLMFLLINKILGKHSESKNEKPNVNHQVEKPDHSGHIK